uniref:hypothetical protein n=1 Tax=Actinomadura sp. CA-154981 TaxID=3240037 RepID=UPI003F498A6D
MAWADAGRCICQVGEVSIAKWLPMSAAATSGSTSDGRFAAVAASKPWTTASLSMLDIQNRPPDLWSPEALNTGATQRLIGARVHDPLRGLGQPRLPPAGGGGELGRLGGQPGVLDDRASGKVCVQLGHETALIGR